MNANSKVLLSKSALKRLKKKEKNVGTNETTNEETAVKTTSNNSNKSITSVPTTTTSTSAVIDNSNEDDEDDIEFIRPELHSTSMIPVTALQLPTIAATSTSTNNLITPNSPAIVPLEEPIKVIEKLIAPQQQQQQQTQQPIVQTSQSIVIEKIIQQAPISIPVTTTNASTVPVTSFNQQQSQQLSTAIGIGGPPGITLPTTSLPPGITQLQQQPQQVHAQPIQSQQQQQQQQPISRIINDITPIYPQTAGSSALLNLLLGKSNDPLPLPPVSQQQQLLHQQQSQQSKIPALNQQTNYNTNTYNLQSQQQSQPINQFNTAIAPPGFSNNYSQQQSSTNQPKQMIQSQLPTQQQLPNAGYFPNQSQQYKQSQQTHYNNNQSQRLDNYQTNTYLDRSAQLPSPTSYSYPYPLVDISANAPSYQPPEHLRQSNQNSLQNNNINQQTMNGLDYSNNYGYSQQNIGILTPQMQAQLPVQQPMPMYRTAATNGTPAGYPNYQTQKPMDSHSQQSYLLQQQQLQQQQQILYQQQTARPNLNNNNNNNNDSQQTNGFYRNNNNNNNKNGTNNNGNANGY